MVGRAFLTLLIPLLIGQVAWSQDSNDFDSAAAEILLPAPVTNLTARDKPNDHGRAIVLKWDLSVDDGKGQNTVTGYKVERWVPKLLDSVVFTAQRLVGKHNLLILSDEGTSNRIEWVKAHPDDSASIDSVTIKRTDEELEIIIDSLRLLAADLEARVTAAHLVLPDSANGQWRMVGTMVPWGQSTFEHSGIRSKTDSSYLPNDVDLFYRVTALTVYPDSYSISVPVGPVQSSSQWYNGNRLPVLIGVVFFTLLTLGFVQAAKKGANLYVRPLPGIEAVDDAIGRATEMGRPILYIMGLGDASQIATIASFTILGRVAKKVAEYQTTLIVPCYDPIVMAVGQEVVKSAFLDAGYPDAYDPDSVYFVTQSQFAYVAAVNGTMLRELPATNLYLGKFFAESLLLAETGALAGSIQIAGTDEIPQIPFFIVACDYTLIGEELFAASAYLGREPILLGSLKAQDYAKVALIAAAIVGLILVNIGGNFESLSWLANFKDLFVVAD